jgi:hypothetical protein
MADMRISWGKEAFFASKKQPVQKSRNCHKSVMIMPQSSVNISALVSAPMVGRTTLKNKTKT